MKICVIGSSHAAALKAAWDKESKLWPVKISFFASQAGNFSSSKKDANLQRRGDVVFPTNEKLRESFELTSGGGDIVLSDYDAVVIVALNFKFPLLRPSLTRQVRESVVSEFFYSSWASSVARMIRDRFVGPVVMCPRPLYPDGHRAATRESELESFDDTVELLETVVGNLSVLFLPPPLKALTDDRRFTREEYLSGAPKLKGGNFLADQNRDRAAHMNADYGSLVLREIFEKLGVSQVD